MKNILSVERKGQILSYISILIGIIGFIFFAGSVGEIDPPMPTNYYGLAAGVILIAVAIMLGNTKPAKEYMGRYSNEA